MDLSAATFWWVAAGVVVAAELATGTFYLLMIALGLVAAALAAHAGLGSSAQIITGALVAAIATALWHWKRASAPRAAPAAQNRDVNLDIGERVHVDAWKPDGTARVQYRGTQWTARLLPGAEPTAGAHRVAAVEGNWIVLDTRQPALIASPTHFRKPPTWKSPSSWPSSPSSSSSAPSRSCRSRTPGSSSGWASSTAR